MTLKDAVTKFDSLCKNSIPAKIKVDWLSNFDFSVYKEIIQTRENPIVKDFVPYTPNSSENSVLLIEDPYSDIYIKYLSMKKDLYYSDISRYNNDLALFTAAYMDFENYYNSKHKPLKNVDFFNV